MSQSDFTAAKPTPRSYCHGLRRPFSAGQWRFDDSHSADELLDRDNQMNVDVDSSTGCRGWSSFDRP